MPVMWFAKDGARPHSQSGSGISVSVAEAFEIIGSHEIRFAGAEAPSINSGHPSSHPNNVVFEVASPLDGGGALARTGFYVVVGLKPNEAEKTLGTLRGEV